MYVNIPVRENTKKLLDDFRKLFGAKSYDDTVKELAKASSFRLFLQLKGTLAGTPKFERDKIDRNFG